MHFRLAGRARTRGAALMETAMALPVLVLMLCAVMEVGREANIMQTLTNAAREGARWSAMPSEGSSSLPATSAVVAKVDQYLSAANINSTNAKVTVNQNVTENAGGLSTSFSQVDVTYAYSFQDPVLEALLTSLTGNSSIALGGHALMRNETN